MPRMPDELLNCAIYLYNSVEHAKDGVDTGGTGFMVGVWSRYGAEVHQHVYVVTNLHVITHCGNYPVIRLNTNDDENILKTNANDWTRHEGDDLAVHPLNLSDDYQRSCIGIQTFLEKHHMSIVGPGTETVMVGRFITHDGKQKNLPSLRFGNIAMMPLEPIWNAEFKFPQESFLVEMRSVGGYSGSPVFAYLPANSNSRLAPRYPTSPVSGRSLRFIGVDWCHISRYENVIGDDGNLTTPRMRVPSNTGMCGVIPAWRLADLLGDEGLEMKRQERNKQMSEERKTRSGAAVLDSAPEEAILTEQDFQQSLQKVARRLPSSRADEEKK